MLQEMPDRLKLLMDMSAKDRAETLRWMDAVPLYLPATSYISLPPCDLFIHLC